MRRLPVVIAAFVLSACSAVAVGPGSSTTTSQSVVTTTTVPSTTTSSSTFGHAVGGHLVKLDMETFEPVPGLDPIPLHLNSWTIESDDGNWVVVFDWGKLRPIEVGTWIPTGTFERPPNTARVIYGDTLYMYSPVNGVVSSIDLNTGELSKLGEWRPNLRMRDDLHVMANGVIAGLGDAAPEEDHWGGPWAGTFHWIHWLDPASGDSGEIEVGPIEQYVENSGVFDGDYEVAQIDHPGVVWGEDRLFIVHADGPEITVVDLVTRAVETHGFDLTSWWDRVVAYWVPSATAKGPDLGTESSAVLSADGHYLLISGVRYDLVTAEDGTVVEENEPLGLIVVDTRTWKIVDRPELSLHSLERVGDLVIGHETVSYSPWTHNLYVLSVDEAGRTSHAEPLLVEDEGCESLVDPGWLVCRESRGGKTQLSLVDVRNLETTDGPEVGYEDHLLRNGVLADWAPFGD